MYPILHSAYLTCRKALNFLKPLRTARALTFLDALKIVGFLAEEAGVVLHYCFVPFLRQLWGDGGFLGTFTSLRFYHY